MTDVKNIFVAYNEIMVYSITTGIHYPNSNLEEYDVHPWYNPDANKRYEIEKKFNIKFPHTLSNEDSDELKNELSRYYSQSFEGLLDNTEKFFIADTLDNLIEKDVNFIYPIILYNNDLFHKYDTISLRPDLVEKVIEGKAKIVFTQLTEGYFGINKLEYRWICDLVKKYGFNKKQVVLLTSNLVIKEKYNEFVENDHIIDNYTVIPYSYFQHNLWFYNTGKFLKEESKKRIRIEFEKSIYKNSKTNKNKHFLCFNRIPKSHRLLIFAELMTNKKFENKFITSLGTNIVNTPVDFYNSILESVKDGYKHDRKKLLDFYSNYDTSVPYVYDESDLENNKAEVINLNAQRDTFVNIITESLTENYSIFFSEKTYKPIFCAQPFIIVGNPFSLKKLKEDGFQTFSKWWDESYDNEVDFTKRMGMIIDLMEEISTWDEEKCFRITNEMSDVFRNNLEAMLDTKSIKEIYNIFSDFDATTNNAPIQKLI